MKKRWMIFLFFIFISSKSYAGFWQDLKQDLKQKRERAIEELRKEKEISEKRRQKALQKEKERRENNPLPKHPFEFYTIDKNKKTKENKDTAENKDTVAK